MADKRPEMAVFKPKQPFSWKGKQCVSNVRLTHKQVEAEIEMGMHAGGRLRREKSRPNSAILNHCSLVSASEDTKKALKKFGA